MALSGAMAGYLTYPSGRNVLFNGNPHDAFAEHQSVLSKQTEHLELEEQQNSDLRWRQDQYRLSQSSEANSPDGQEATQNAVVEDLSTRYLMSDSFCQDDYGPYAVESLWDVIKSEPYYSKPTSSMCDITVRSLGSNQCFDSCAKVCDYTNRRWRNVPIFNQCSKD
ncbi:hypothetical protein MMC28_009220 [Mycoblastus sanguinarius]|nr:hypothetical protein [Mycoblastus sanguinarius]